MADQRNNAGNIGDVIKHTLLPVLLEGFDDEQSRKWIYCETHAGFFDYRLIDLKKEDEWKGERAWSVGVIQGDGKAKRLGSYGQVLMRALNEKVYPGSLRIVDSTISEKKLCKILGWDTEDGQVDSHKGKSKRIEVRKGDGYRGARAINDSPKLVFCDPFWAVKSETRKVQLLLEQEKHVVAWYPIAKNTEEFRKWRRTQNYCFVEIEFQHWQPGKGGWAAQNSRGAGLVLKGLPDIAFLRAMTLANNLKEIFDGRLHMNKPREGEGGSTVAPRYRDLSLRISASCK